MTCLVSARERDLGWRKGGGGSVDGRIRIWAEAAWWKALAHGTDTPGRAADGADHGDGFVRPARTMSAIGG